MSGYLCPFCNKVMTIEDNMRDRIISFYNSNFNNTPSEDRVKITFYKCPSCEKISIKLKGLGDDVEYININVHPNSSAKQFPDYVPQAIRQDYEEACAIVDLSPKASATLARRSLQGMIHDFWGIKLKNLNHEITALKDKIQPDLWASIDALRQLGNIGAHMEKDTDVIVDIDPNEATSLIKLIELLIKEWYINREERKKLFSEIITTNESKQNQRNKTE